MIIYNYIIFFVFYFIEDMILYLPKTNPPTCALDPICSYTSKNDFLLLLLLQWQCQPFLSSYSFLSVYKCTLQEALEKITSITFALLAIHPFSDSTTLLKLFLLGSLTTILDNIVNCLSFTLICCFLF